MIIRQATSEDLKQIADVHFRCFPDSFSTQLGKAQGGVLQQRFYKEYLDEAPELFLVAEDETLASSISIVGFCMGYYLKKNDYMKNFLKHNRFTIILRVAVLLLIGNKAAWKKVLGRFKKSGGFSVVNNNITIDHENTSDLLSICVLQEYRGGGDGSEINRMLSRNIKKKEAKNMSFDSSCRQWQRFALL